MDTLLSGITPNDIVEEITELTNPQAEGLKRKKNSKKNTKKKEDIKGILFEIILLFCSRKAA